MPRNPFTTTYDPRHHAHRTVREWRNPGIATWQTLAKAYARTHGEARILRADGSVIVYWLTAEGRIRQRTYHKVMFVREP